LLPRATSAYCGDHPTIAAEFARSEFVFVGKAVSETIIDRGLNGVGGTNYRVEVERALRGQPKHQITIFSENSSGRFPLDNGERYILFVGREVVEAFPRAVYTVSYCGHSGHLPESQHVLREVQRLAKRPPPNHSLNPDASPAALARRPLGAG